jgi:hypothetical protein
VRSLLYEERITIGQSRAQLLEALDRDDTRTAGHQVSSYLRGAAHMVGDLLRVTAARAKKAKAGGKKARPALNNYAEDEYYDGEEWEEEEEEEQDEYARSGYVEDARNGYSDEFLRSEEEDDDEEEEDYVSVPPPPPTLSRQDSGSIGTSLLRALFVASDQVEGKEPSEAEDDGSFEQVAESDYTSDSEWERVAPEEGVPGFMSYASAIGRDTQGTAEVKPVALTWAQAAGGGGARRATRAERNEENEEEGDNYEFYAMAKTQGGGKARMRYRGEGKTQWKPRTKSSNR